MSTPSWIEKYCAKILNSGFTSTKKAPPLRDEVAEEAARIRAEWAKKSVPDFVEVSADELEASKIRALHQSHLHQVQLQQAQMKIQALAQQAQAKIQIYAGGAYGGGAGYGTGGAGGTGTFYTTATTTNLSGQYDPAYFIVPPIRPDAEFMKLYEAELERARYLRDVEET